ncbi:MAG: hypothetical protein ACTHMY_12985 [Solirubrobacteraceae bacterium]
MPACSLKGERPLHNGLGGSLPPRNRGDRRDADDVTELDTLDVRGQLVSDELAHR